MDDLRLAVVVLSPRVLHPVEEALDGKDTLALIDLNRGPLCGALGGAREWRPVVTFVGEDLDDVELLSVSLELDLGDVLVRGELVWELVGEKRGVAGGLVSLVAILNSDSILVASQLVEGDSSDLGHLVPVVSQFQIIPVAIDQLSLLAHLVALTKLSEPSGSCVVPGLVALVDNSVLLESVDLLP